MRPLIDLPEERFLVLPRSVDLDDSVPGRTGGIRKKYGLPESFVICPGALTSSKGPQNVVAASEEYGDLAPTGFIGDGELRAELEPQLGDRGKFLGFVPAEDRALLVNAASILTAAPRSVSPTPYWSKDCTDGCARSCRGDRRSSPAGGIALIR